MSERDSADVEPVTVIEAIPVNGDHAVKPEVIRSEAIPTPSHLAIYPELGRGGMGRVHPAMDKNLLRPVALKRLDKKLATVPMYRDGFVAEAQITGQLEHPNIVPVHELAISPEGVPYFTMKLVQGIGLDRWLADPARPAGSTERLQEGLEIFLKICDAVAYAHHRGVIHRDLKPENVMIAGFGQVYLMDWGLSRLTKSRPASGEMSQMEAPGPVGTPAYMAPEQARGNPAEMDERSDVFGLGALLYEIVSGHTPYGKAKSAKEILAKAVAGQVVPLEAVTFGMDVSKRLRAIVARAVAPEPAQRFQSVLELQDDVRRFLRGGLYLPSQIFMPGTVIVREGDVGDTAYMIVSGRCRAFRDLPDGDETLAIMEAGDVFGEMALLLDEPRAASVEAVDQVTVLVLDKRTMNDELGIEGWSSKLVRALAERFRNLEQQVRKAGMRRG
ncbi:MAG: protein kinase [Myxococcales bacterium]|nr:protein kinase [Myxococcales bacterium]MCB9581912.1 protein kinase [Polyangiaceae bacterium]